MEKQSPSQEDGDRGKEGGRPFLAQGAVAAQGLALGVPFSCWDLRALIHGGSLCSACEGPGLGTLLSSAGLSLPSCLCPGLRKKQAKKKPKTA